MVQEFSRSAQDVFAGYLTRVNAGEEVDLEALGDGDAALLAELKELHRRWLELGGVLDRLGVAGSLTQRIEESFGTEVMSDVTIETREPSARSSSNVLDRLSGRSGAYGRYALEGEVARGGMGAILRVWDEDLRRHLAMKVILAEARPDGNTPRADARTLGRFLEEAQVTGQLDHPGIVPVHELGLDSHGRAYFTMKLVRGESLAEVFDKAKKGEDGWTRTRVLGALLRVCEAMAYAHEKRVVHRDLKPANVMVGRHGEVYVMDWGLARVEGHRDRHDLRPQSDVSIVRTDRGEQRKTEADSPLVTHDGTVVGTPYYMPPEQAEGRVDEVGTRSDVYAVGAMLYQLLTGRMPYQSPGAHASPHTVLAMVIQGPPRPIEQAAGDVAPELVAICKKSMARHARDRYADMGELAEDLRAFLENRVVQAHRTGAFVEFRKWVQRNRALAAAAALLVLATPVVAALGTYVASTRDDVLAAKLQARDDRVEALLEAGFLHLAESNVLEKAVDAPASASTDEAFQPVPLAASTKTGDPVAAIERFEEALIERADTPLAIAGLALAHLELGDAVRAVERLDAYATTAQTVPALQRLRASALEEAGDSGGAETIEARLAEPSDALDHYVSGRLMLRHPEERDGPTVRRAAARFLDAILSSPSAYPIYYFDYAAVLAELGAEEGEPLARALQSLWPESPGAQYHAGVLYGAAGRDGAAIAAYEESIRIDPATPAYNNLAGVYRQVGELESAIRTYEAGVARQPGSANVRHNLGLAYFAVDRVPEAVESYREAIRLDPDDFEHHYSLALALLSAGELDEAEQAVREAIRLEPGFARSHDLLGSILTGTGEVVGALEAFRTASQLDPGLGIAHGNLSKTLFDLGRFDEALPASERTVELLPDSPKAFSNLGATLRRLGRDDEAIEAFHEAIRLEPDDFHAHHNLGLALIALGRADEAVPVLREAVRTDEVAPYRSLAALANAFSALGDVESAIEANREAIRLEPRLRIAHYNLGNQLMALRRYEEAIASFETAIELDKSRGESYCNLSICLEKLGRFSEALAMVRQGHEVGSQDPNWPYDSAAWIRDTEGLVRLEEELLAVLDGSGEVRGAIHRAELADIAYRTKRYEVSATLYGELLESDPASVLSHRYSGACSAVLAARETGDAGLADKALAWLGANLASYHAADLDEPEVTAAVLATLRHWRTDPDLQGLRPESPLPELSTDQQEACRTLWLDVDALIDELD